ncbi:hypothetical protein Dsin_001562 [Dipteronia sinensis]|uniref:HAT C-terminal dimerisation domain-containing protein n=1 Tax=Dipteronia sinensis TaxID=43782 RepID=A0AAE0B4L8_9ROSI|nr:hypothetical protein Dsin_001562 [Dipteronia sinensis]
MLEEDSQTSLNKEIDSNHQESSSSNLTNLELLAKIESLEKQIDGALREVEEKDYLIKLQVDEFVPITQKLLCLFCVFSDSLHKVLGRNKATGISYPPKPIDKPKSTSSTSKKSKSTRLNPLGTMGTKKLLQERGIDLCKYRGSYVHQIIVDRNWGTRVNMLGMVNDSLVREFYQEYKYSTTNVDALMDARDIVFRVNSENINKLIGLSNDIESDFFDVEISENLTLMGRTQCDDNDFEWGNRAFISQIFIINYSMASGEEGSRNLNKGNGPLQDLLEHEGRVSVCADIWTNNFGSHHYIGVTCHFMDNEWVMQKRIIAFRFFDESHTTQNIFRLLKIIFEEFHIQNKIFAIDFDNAASNTASIPMLQDLCNPYFGETSHEFFEDSEFSIQVWWKDHEQIFPILAIIAKQILGKLISTVTVEQEFSASGNILEPRRSVKCPQTLEAQACVDDWTKAKCRLQEIEAEIVNDFFEDDQTTGTEGSD